MSRFLWLRPLAHGLLGRRRREPSANRPAVSSRRRVRLRLEILEDRLTPNNTFTPTTLLDDGTTNSLRGAITEANNDTSTGTDTIQLAVTDSSHPYTLSIANAAGNHDVSNTQGDLNITSTSHNLVIQGTTDASGHPTTTIDAKSIDRVFEIGQSGTPLTGITVTFKNLIIEGGKAQDNGGAGTAAGSSDANGGGILDYGGNVTLSNVVIQENSAKAGPGFNASGGGIYVKDGSLTVQGSAISTNKAFGGDESSSTTTAKSALGGGIFASGTTTITGSTIADNILQSGAGTNIGFGGAEGGSIYAEGTTTITGSSLEDNVLTGGNTTNGTGGGADGGSIFFNSSTGSLSITGAILSGNSLTGGKGDFGGKVEGGSIAFSSTSGTLTITTSDLQSNVLTGGTGSISAAGTSSSADDGGDAYGGSIFAGNSTTTITASTLSGNKLTGGSGSINNSGDSIGGDLGGRAEGGSVYIASGATANIGTSTLSGNKLTGGTGSYSSGIVKGNIGGDASGGGVYADSTAKATTLTASTLSGNTVTGGGVSSSGSPGNAQGGGAYLAGPSTALVNSTITGNQVIGGKGAPGTIVVDGKAEGGGLFFASTATATLTNVTVADNKASFPDSSGLTIGGGIDNDSGTVTLVNTLVAGNSIQIFLGSDTGPDYAGAVSNSSHNLIGIQDGSSGFGAAHKDLLGSAASPLDPHLGQLTKNGGPTQTMALLPGSPAINAGDNTAQSATGPNDQRGQGFLRVVNGSIDIGAFEVQPSPPPPGGGGGGSGGSGGGAGGRTPPSLFQALISLYIDGIELEALDQGNLAGFHDSFAVASMLGELLQFFGNPDFNTIESSIAFNLPYASPFGSLAVLLGEAALLQALPSS